MKKQFVLLLLIAINWVNAQTNQSYIIQDSTIEHFTLDIKENIYTWEGTVLQKYDNQNRLLHQIDNPALGNISYVYVDETGALIFYAESGTFVFTDDKLSPIGNQPNLYNHNLNDITLAAYFPNSPSRIVLYDNLQHDLIMTNKNLKIVSQTHCTFKDFAPTQIWTVNSKRIYLFNPNNGFYLFDQFGTFDKKIPIPKIDYAYITPTGNPNASDNIFYLVNDEMHCYDTYRMEDKILSESNNIREFIISNGKLWNLDGIGIYKTKP